MKTARGLAVTTDSTQAIGDIDYFHQQIVSSGKSADAVLEAAKNHVDNLLIQTYAAAFYLYGQEHTATNNATAYLLQAEKCLRTANLREKLTYQAVRAWQRLDYECAISLFTSIAALFPRDTLAIKFAEWLFYCSGQAFQAKRFLALCEKSAPENQDESHFLAIHSFALELCGHYSQAKVMAERAIDMDLLTPWAHHTLAHVYLLQNDISSGISCLRKLQPSWDKILPLLKGHNSWHLALFYLANRKKTETIELFNSSIFGIWPDTVLEQLDAISLLWRLDMAGFPQDDLFKEIAGHLNQHPYEQYTGFNSIHFLYCLARIDDEKAINRALETMITYAKALQPGYAQNLWHNVTLPFCKGILAFVRKDYHASCDMLAPIITDCFQMGGSDAQDELFLQTYLLSLLRSKRQVEAEQFFAKYLSHYKNTPLAEYWFTNRH